MYKSILDSLVALGVGGGGGGGEEGRDSYIKRMAVLVVPTCNRG